MEDQFGGRTDDDLFYDDFEPVKSDAVASGKPAQPVSGHAPATQAQAGQDATIEPPSTETSTPATTGLAQSRFAEKPSTSTPSSQPAPAPPANAPKAPREKPRAPAPQNQNPNPNPSDPNARLQSGANPRQKLTDDELAAKMEQMKLLAAEKTRKFEMAEEDEKQHAAAYAKGMEEAKKRRADEAERRRRGEEDRKKMDDERAKNRERKLKAMGTKDNSWDEGKEAIAEEEARRVFRGANGGIRGARSGGLSDSRYARTGDEPDVDRFLDDRYRNRGRGRARGGRGGRGGGHDTAHNGAATSQNPAKQGIPKTEDFPALPSGATKKTDAASSAAEPPMPAPLSLSPPPAGTKWDDEMEAMDAAKQGKS